MEIELDKPETASAESQIHYTTDGSVPDGASTVYTDKLNLSNTTSIKARLVHPDGSMGPVGSAMYFETQRSLNNASSNLPYIVLENYGDGRPPSGDYQIASMAIIEPERGRSRFRNEIAVASQVGIKTRGSSTGGRSKASLSLELQDEFGEDKNLSLLGMPSESDWVLWGPYNFDLSLMHNPFIYELSRQIGRYAPRTRFVEVYLNTNGGALSTGDYFGVYALIEKIDRDADRVDVEKLFPEHQASPEVSGGYILKIDRADPGDSGFGAAGQSIKYVYPKEEQMESKAFDPHEKALRQYLNDMGNALNGANFRDPDRGYAKYIDVEAAIDHHLLNVVAFNVDALRLSTYMHIPRGGKLTYGPIWDFDRALGSTDGRDSNPKQWRGGGGTDFFNYPWWNRMFQDIDFYQKYIDRFQELRRAQFSNDNINGLIDRMAGELFEAQKRNLARWNQRPRSRYGGTYEGEIRHMQTWLGDRITFMESQFVDPPTSDKPAGYIPPGTVVTLKSPEGGKIYYTLDGTDPRRSGGKVATKAKLYTDPIVINESTLLTARVYKSNHRARTGSGNPPLTSKWSGTITPFYSIAPPPAAGDLVFSEIHYHPLDPAPGELAVDSTFRSSDFEFVELFNNSRNALNLSGLSIGGEVRFSFLHGTDKILEPGERFLIVRNARAFAVRYGSEIPVIGEYQGKLSNGGGPLELSTQRGKSILKLNYLDDWFPTTDGQGFSLVAKDGATQDEKLGKDGWRPSWNPNGSPGQADERTEVFFTAIQVGPSGVILSLELPKDTGVEVQSIDTLGQALGQAQWKSFKVIAPSGQAQSLKVFDLNPGAAQRFYRLKIQSGD